MRNLRFYLISVAIHLIVLGPLAYAFIWKIFAPPQFSVRSGGGTGGDGREAGDAVVFEGEFVPCGEMLEFHVDPPPKASPAPLRKIVTEARNMEPVRLFAPALENRLPVRTVEPPIPEPPPPAPPAVPAAKIAPRAAEPVDRLPSATRPKVATVDVGELLKGAAETQAVPSSGEGASAPQNAARQAGGRSGGSGGSVGWPTASGANVRPTYPAEALARGIEGVVMLRVVVGENGAVRSVKVETSSGDASLDQSALTTVHDRWHFEPGLLDGTPIECEVRVPIRFRMHGDQ
jgi:protein TonB